MFKPNDRAEADIFALEELRAEIQYDILRMLHEDGITKAGLARELGVSSARVSQLLDDDANLTLETLAKISVALRRKLRFRFEPLESDCVAGLEDQMAKLAIQDAGLEKWFETREADLVSPKAWNQSVVSPSKMVRRSGLRFDEIRNGSNDNFAETRAIEVA
jgi:transcriptional regulator with XRE-family HTH domain